MRSQAAFVYSASGSVHNQTDGCLLLAKRTHKVSENLWVRVQGLGVLARREKNGHTLTKNTPCTVSVLNPVGGVCCKHAAIVQGVFYVALARTKFSIAVCVLRRSSMNGVLSSSIPLALMYQSNLSNSKLCCYLCCCRGPSWR